MKPWRGTMGCLFLLMLVVLDTVLIPGSAHAASEGPNCQSFNVPVALGVGLPVVYTIYAERCDPPGGSSHTIQVLVPGGTYGHIYWNFPYEPQNYSYVHALTAAGYSTFSIDRIGIGESSHPLIGSVTITMGINAYIVHEIIQDLRHGRIGNVSFDHVLLVGHSLGSVTDWVEAGTYHDVDGVIISGLLHHLNTLSLLTVVGTLYPTILDPRFAGKGYVGYLTTVPGTRGRDFYYLPGTDPNVLAMDEATKETATPGEFGSFALPIVDGISMQIQVPVLVVVGQQDALFCGFAATNCSSAASVQQAEAPYYTRQAQLHVVVIPQAGHDLNLHKTAPLWFAAATTWSLQHVAP